MASAAPHRKSSETKRERMELRVASSAKALIQRAMAVSGMTAGDLAYEGARRISMPTRGWNWSAPMPKPF